MNQLREIYDYREMIFSLVKRDLRGRYKGSVLGFLWTFINPLLQLIVYTMVFSVIMRSDIEQFYIFLFVALVPWMFFSASITSGAGAVLAQKSMVSKIYFPREVLPIAYVTSAFVNMLLTFIVIFLVLILSGFGINLKAILYLPIVFVIEYIMALGMAFVVSSVTVYFRDLEYILGIVTMAWQFLSPVMYSIDMVPKEILPIFYLNPMTNVILAYRDILYYKMIPNMSTLIGASIFGAVVFFIGVFVFAKLKRGFAEEI